MDMQHDSQKIKLFFLFLLIINISLQLTKRNESSASSCNYIDNDNDNNIDPYTQTPHYQRALQFSNYSNNVNSSVTDNNIHQNIQKKKTYAIGGKEKILITNLLNKERRNTKPVAISMKRMVWDSDLEEKMQNYVNSIDPKTLFLPDPRFPNKFPGFDKNLLLFHISELPEFSELRNNKKCRFFIHDTFDSSNRNAVWNIFRFRVNQKNSCYRFGKCDPNVFSHFTSCDKISINIPGMPCAGAGRYYGNFLNQVQSTYACIILNVPGPSTPDPRRQDNSFVCLACDEDITWIQNNDIPFTTGKVRASNCEIYANHTENQNGLCSKPKTKKLKAG